MELQEHDQFVHVTGDEDEELKPGDVGVIIHIHPEGEVFVVEFSPLTATRRPSPLSCLLRRGQ